MQIDLTGRVILVTGASRGIGSAIAAALAHSGATVAFHANKHADRAAAMAAEAGQGATVFIADLAVPRECSGLVRRVVDHFGRIDVLVNNAGMAVSAPLEDARDVWIEKWDSTLDVNLRAPAILSKEAILYFTSSGQGGRIINIASRAAFRGDTPEYLAYAASKGGMVALTRSIARGYGKDGIVAFLIAPGFTRTDMAMDFIRKYGEAHAAHDLALDRLTEPEDIAPMVVLLAGGLADHATGTTIDFNAGSYVH